MEAQTELQWRRHREKEEEVGATVLGYASQVLGLVQRQSDFLELVELPDAVSSKVWTGALLLRELLLARGPWSGRSVLELGAGVGLVGLAAAAAGAEVLLTDLGEALPVLEDNVRRNEALVLRSGGRARAAELDWLWDGERQRRSLLPRSRFDLAVGADVVYTVEAALALLRTALGFTSELWLLQNIHRAATSEFLDAAAASCLCVERELVEDPYEFWKIRRESSEEGLCATDYG